MKLEFLTHEVKYVCEAFGIEEPAFNMLIKALIQHMRKEEDVDNKEPASKSRMLEEFLSSKAFADLNFPLETANDFFILGYAFNAALKLIKGPDNFFEFLGAMASHRHDESSDDEERQPN